MSILLHALREKWTDPQKKKSSQKPHNFSFNDVVADVVAEMKVFYRWNDKQNWIICLFFSREKKNKVFCTVHFCLCRKNASFYSFFYHSEYPNEFRWWCLVALTWSIGSHNEYHELDQNFTNEEIERRLWTTLNGV